MDRDEIFQQHRPLLFSIAYRMLGSVADAEDVLQEAFIRWQQVAKTDVRSPKPYLSTVVTRLCLDHLRSAKVRREEYVGSWLPEPLLTDGSLGVAETIELDETLSMAFLVLLERLTPVERAVFLLREVFSYDYAEISRVVGKSETNCRQIARRARESVAAGRPRFETSTEHEESLMGSFIEACTDGDMEGLLAVLSEDVILWSDGGGKVRAALNPIYGPEKVSRFLLSILGKVPPGFNARTAQINGQPGVIGYVGGQPMSALTLEAAGGQIRTIRIVVNPEKLEAIPSLW